MSLARVQNLITRTMRDAEFRVTLRGADFDKIVDKYDLDPAERDAVRAIRPDYLDKIAGLVLRQRIQRREAEFALFLNALFAHTHREAFFREYHQAVTVGQFGRLEEARRFVDFAFEFVLRHQLPGYLLDVLRFSLHVLELAETPKEIPADVVNNDGADQVTASTRVLLRKPYSVVSFQYDILLLATEDEAYTCNPVPRAKTLLLQRDWRQPKRSRAFDLLEHPVIALLAEGSATVLDIVGRLPQFSADLVVNLVRSLYDRRVVHLIPPAELARYGVLAPRENPSTVEGEVA
jgi:hypothetical protein